MTTATFTITGEVNVSVTITENIDGTLTFDLAVLDDTGSIGDLNAIFFDLYDDSLTGGLSVEGADITETVFKVDGVTKVDNFTNMNGEVIKDLGKFDGGIQFGTQGIGGDDIRETSFTLSHATADLTLADFSMQDFGVRLTSVGEEGGSRDESLKFGGVAPEFEDDPVSVSVANNDSITVLEFETFNPSDPDGFIFFSDPLDSGATSILANDTTDGGVYTGDVAAVNGDAANIEQIVAGSDGGVIRIYADGTVDFSASPEFGVNDFAYLNDGESAQTTFEYGIDGGDTAILTVTVLGASDPGGPGGPGGPGDGGGDGFFG